MVWGFAVPGWVSAQTDPTLHALLVFDTDSTLKPFLAGNQALLEQVFDQTFRTRPKNYEKKVLIGEGVTRKAVLDYYVELKQKQNVKPEDVLLFYYGGHGATLGDQGHCLTMFHDDGGPYLSRKELLEAMKDLNARHIVVLTDCCSVVISPEQGSEMPLPKASWPVIDCLLFQHKGVTDINACQQNAFSWFYNNDKEAGGAFTLALAPLLCTRKDDFNKVFGSDDGFVTWKQFARPLQTGTNQKYQTLRDAFLKMLPEDLDPGQRQNQTFARNQKEQTPELNSVGDRDEQRMLRRTWLFGTKLGTGRNAQGVNVGTVVGTVYADTPAAKAGIEEGDVILAVNGVPTLTDLDAFREIDHSNGKIAIKVRRGATEPQLVEVTLSPVKPEEKRLNP